MRWSAIVLASVKTLAPLFLVTTVAGSAVEAGPDRRPNDVLREALQISGFAASQLPIVLTSVRPPEAHPLAEGWVRSPVEGIPRMIYLATDSEPFLCALRSRDYRCRVMVASIIVHEVWHWKFGAGEDDAYRAQIMFLMANGVDGVDAMRVRRARDLVRRRARTVAEAVRLATVATTGR